MRRADETTDVLVIGAGMAGLVAAGALQSAGRRVVVVDKGRGVGGRLATRRMSTEDGATARLDHGAQFFTVRTPRFATLVDTLVGLGIVHEWARGFDDAPDGHPRFVARDGMTSIAKHLAAPLDVRTGVRIATIRTEDDQVVAETDDGVTLAAERAIITAPAPQAIELVGEHAPDALGAITYDPTLCLLALLDRPLGGVGARQRPSGVPIEFLADNAAKGVSPVPALTAHLTGEESRRRWDDPDDATIDAVAAMVEPLLGGARIHSPQLKRWRYATPVTLHPDPVLVHGRMLFAGDAFGTPRVEGAATSGWAAADALLG